MTSLHRTERVAEHIVGAVMLIVFWVAFACLGSGLVLWARNHASDTAALLLTAGLISLMLLPMLRLIEAVAASRRERDWLTLGSTVAVLVILCALTLRDALG